MSAQVDKLVKIYKALSRTQAMIGGKISESGLLVSTYWTQKDIEKGKYVKFTKSHIVNNKLEILTDSIPIDTTNELLSALGPSEKYRAVVREISNGKDDLNQYLEIWRNNFLKSNVDLTTLGIHGNVYTDVDFGSLEWSPDETKVIFIAEKKFPKREPFYKRKPEKPNNGDGDNPPTRGEEYIYRQDWGEQNVGKCQSVIVMYDINEDNVKILDGIPEHLCPGQILWSPDGSKIAGIVWDTRPRKLGIVYCSNRPSRIFTLDLSGNYHELSEEGCSIQSPKFTPDGKYLIWLERCSGGHHRAVMALMKFPFSNNCSDKKAIPVVEIVATEICTTNCQPFYGLYDMKLPRRCWAKDNKRLIFSTIQKYQIKSYVLDIESGELTEFDSDSKSLTIYDVYDDKILASKKCFTHTDIVLIGQLPEKGCESNICWSVIQDAPVIVGLEKYTYHYMDISHNNTDDVQHFHAIYFGPKDGDSQSVPLVMWPHGGPHASVFNEFTIESSLFASIGFALLFVNFRGSLGCGQKSINFLPGRNGDADVKDCILAAQEACKQFAWINPNKLVLRGGSYGGFLVHHLSGQCPDLFKAVVSRNPVIDIATMSIISDAPDWCSVETGCEYSQKGIVNDDLFLAMRKASPIQYVHKVKAPTYLMLGTKDLRVPCALGIEFFNRLRANNVTVKMNLYDDNHPLASVPAEMDKTINGALWLLEHTA